MQCQTCGQWGDGARYHPHLFCQLIKSGITDDPEAYMHAYGWHRREGDR